MRTPLAENEPKRNPGRALLSTLVAVYAPRLLIRYASIGATAALIEMSLFYCLLTWAALPLMAANVIAVCTVTGFGFFAQKHFTFRAGGRLTPQAALYCCQVAINFVLNNALVFLFAHVLAFPPLLAKILQLGLCFVFNFSFSRLVVFGFGSTTASRD